MMKNGTTEDAKGEVNADELMDSSNSSVNELNTSSDIPNNPVEKTEVKAEDLVLSISNSTLPELNISSSITNNNAAEWKKWWQHLELYILATDLDKATEKRKIAILLHFMGSKGLEIYNSFNLDMDTATLATVKDKFDKYFEPNLTMIRHKFFTRKQNSSESVDDFITELNNLSTDCEFGTLRKSLVKDIFIANMCSSLTYVRQRLLHEPDLELEKAAELAKTVIAKNSEKNMKDDASSVSASSLTDENRHLRTRKSSQIRTFSARPSGPAVPWTPSQRPRFSHQSQSSFPQKFNPQSKPFPIEPCGRCGQRHRFKCPAANILCRSCNLFGHFAKYCFKNKNARFVGANSYKVDNSRGAKRTFLGTGAQ